MLEALLATMLSLAPERDRAALQPVAAAIHHACATREDAALLLTVDYYETRFEAAGIPFGLVSARRRIEGQPLEVWAQTAITMLNGTVARCGSDVAVRLGWYHTGHCRADRFTLREAQTYARVLASLRPER